jgi:hypothetical protein
VTRSMRPCSNVRASSGRPRFLLRIRPLTRRP